ncbi:unannotated protein [freshwater metagenome]|uniref:Unannotated protein n=1 Tax=freshwater metagenome TaxID=449393 RepID=A0A6J7W126_9ZZZZ
MTYSNTDSWEFSIKNFSALRMNSYLRTMVGNREMAVQLYLKPYI